MSAALLLAIATQALASIIERVRLAECEDRLVAVLPTVPRSGNTLFRQMFEIATGTATHTVFDAEPARRTGTSDDVFAGDGAVTHNDAMPIDECAYVVKTHYPFFVVRPLFQFGVQIRSVREPLSNYGAWIDWCHANSYNGTGVCGQTAHFPEFVDSWAAHHTFWDSFGMTATLFNFAYLLYDPIGTLRGVFEQHRALRRFLPALDNETVLARMPEIRPTMRTRLSPGGSCKARTGYFETGKHTRVSVSDYLAALERPDVAALLSRHSLATVCRG